MCVLYVSFGFKVRSKTFECVSMGRAVFFNFEVKIPLRVCSEQSAS